MNDFDTKTSRVRASILVALEQALAILGENLITLGNALRADDVDAEERARHLISDQARAVWGAVLNSDVELLRTVLTSFDIIVGQTEPFKYRVYMDSEHYKKELGPNKLEGMIGAAALLRNYLAKAGFKLTVEPIGMYFFMVVTRP